MPTFDLAGYVRRIRRSADLSQRELAARVSVSKSAIAAAERGVGGLDARILAQAAALAGLRLVLVDESGAEVAAMADGAVRDEAGRRFPAHLDTRDGHIDWWHGRERYSRDQPAYTFDRVRDIRDIWREWLGIPDDHQLPGDASARPRAAPRRTPGGVHLAEEWACTCPPECAELDQGERPVHAQDCPCGCDVG
ncbi:helix-turn-helix domain-containing protein [Petropleomorpha daqingensis]|uniref:HTH-type transcriptional regulator/antitoxin HipB n=1 Tax=Petropleomorpha daqingensis TaxID=2026353 RepID=A0A853CEW6_9ACTN|nr:helix-turn-helix transcriptional regulator [Petropleomorpha daqingensis]NYJ05957.1 HTH-type transcriptional regulator/antitoxin HipB [Petropleomorpha daqingensis]